MVNFLSILTGVLILPTLLLASPLEERALNPGGDPKKCNNYLIIQTRGTYESQGSSLAFDRAINTVYKAIKGGANYNTVYPASENQNSSKGTADIVRRLKEGRKKCPKQVYVLMGYSQGAAATVNALPMIKGEYEDAVQAVILYGDPYRKPGLKSNIDGSGKHTLDDRHGISWTKNSTSVNKHWDNSGKVLDVCLKGDGVCDSRYGGITNEHLQYDRNNATVKLTSSFIIKKLKAAKA